VGVDVPLTLLQDVNLSVDEANKKLEAILSLKRVRRIPPGTVWRGRRYDENLHLFKDTQFHLYL